VKYAFMHGHTGEFSIKAQCEIFGVSRSGYYAWRFRRQSPSRRQMEREKLDNLVARAFEARKGRSGAVGLTLDLDDQGHKYNRKTVAASMRRQKLVAKAAKKYKATTDSDHNLPVAPNRLEQDFCAEAPNRKWVCDISYLWTGEGWLYLAVVLDLFSRMVVGWAMDKRMKAALVCDALQMALWRRRMPKGVVVHSDRGSQYCSRQYQALLARHDLLCSMSGKGNCYDNAVAESFFHTLKVELVHGESFATREDMRRAIFEYIEVDYNRTRRHSNNGYISPLAFENKMVA
jgi:putative transposase